MKIAYISLPIDKAIPTQPGGSLGIWTWELARRMARSCEVVVVGPRARHEAPRAKHEGIEYFRVTVSVDRRLERMVRLQSCIGGRPWFDSSLYYPLYAIKAARI